MHFSLLAQGAALVLAATVLVGGLGHEEGDGRLVNVMRMRRTVTMVMVVGGVLLQQLLQQNLAHERNLRIDGEPLSGLSKKLKSAARTLQLEEIGRNRTLEVGPQMREATESSKGGCVSLKFLKNYLCPG